MPLSGISMEEGMAALKYILDYRAKIHERPVTAHVEPGFLAPTLPKEAPLDPEPFSDILKDIEEKIMPGITHWQHPNFHAYFSSGATFSSVLGDIIAGGLSCNGFSWITSPSYTELETVVMDWLAKALDLPSYYRFYEPGSIGGGCLENSASAAVLNAFFAARYQAICYLKCNSTDKCMPYDQSDNKYLPKLVAYTSEQAHSCVEKAAMMSMVQLRELEPDENNSLRGETLKKVVQPHMNETFYASPSEGICVKAIEKDIAAGLHPFLVVATMGTTGTCGFDNLVEIGEVIKDLPSCWFHVDGAYGGSALILPEFRPLFKGMDLTDSFNFNPYKWMLNTLDGACFWVKNKTMLTSSMKVEPLYLHPDPEVDAMDYRNWGVQLSRRFRVLKVWFTLRMIGITNIQKYMRKNIEMAKHFEKLVRSDDRFEVTNKVVCGLVCFRLKGPDALNENLVALCLAGGKIHLGPTHSNGEYVVRYAICHEDATEADNEFAWKEIVHMAEEALERGEKLVTADASHRWHKIARRFATTPSHSCIRKLRKFVKIVHDIEKLAHEHHEHKHEHKHEHEHKE